MSESMKGSKRRGNQECECCYRWFNVRENRTKNVAKDGHSLDWVCPYCHYDNNPVLWMGKKRQKKFSVFSN
jgi:hypothetical protein